MSYILWMGIAVPRYIIGNGTLQIQSGDWEGTFNAGVPRRRKELPWWRRRRRRVRLAGLLAWWGTRVETLFQARAAPRGLPWRQNRLQAGRQPRARARPSPVRLRSHPAKGRPDAGSDPPRLATVMIRNLVWLTVECKLPSRKIDRHLALLWNYR